MSEKDEFIVRCQCGQEWWMDHQPTPESCVGDIWQLGVIDEEASRGEGIKIAWGNWVDQDGNDPFADKYTSINFMFKNTPHHNVDTVMDMLIDWLPQCNGKTDDEGNVLAPCTCGMESLGGCSGSEEQCWKNQGIHKSISQVDTDDLKKILNLVPWQIRGDKAYKRLYDEAYWWDKQEEDDDTV